MILVTHNYQPPTESEMENLITQVYKSLPNPDKSRLSLIESKLLQKARKNKSQKNLNKIPWWIVLILAGGFVSAAWRASDLFFDKQLHLNNKITEIQPNTNDAKPNIEYNVENNRSNENENSPIIYQRELF